jgi:hypothetical protein
MVTRFQHLIVRPKAIMANVRTIELLLNYMFPSQPSSRLGSPVAPAPAPAIQNSISPVRQRKGQLVQELDRENSDDGGCTYC